MSKSGVGFTGPLEQVGPCQWKIPRSYRADMRVDGLIFADEALIGQIYRYAKWCSGRCHRSISRLSAATSPC